MFVTLNPQYYLQTDVLYHIIFKVHSCRNCYMQEWTLKWNECQAESAVYQSIILEQ